MEPIDGIMIDKRVESVFAEVLAEFRDWKVKYSKHLLRPLSIGKRVPSIPTSSDSSNIDGDSDTEQRLVQQVTVTSYSEDGTSASTSTISLQVIRAEVLEPHEPYESCAPISRNVFKGDDNDRMAFIPFVDS
jgi:hypothetical protein